MELCRACGGVPQAVIDALIDSFHYRLYLVVFHGRRLLSPDSGHQSHEEHSANPTPAQTT
jgi:hypothetical protein